MFSNRSENIGRASRFELIFFTLFRAVLTWRVAIAFEKQPIEIGYGIKAGPSRNIGNAIFGFSKLLPGIFQPLFI